MLIGHEEQVAFLDAVASSSGVPPAVLLSGPSGIGKRDFAAAFAAWVQGDPTSSFTKVAYDTTAKERALCHPDVTVVRGDIPVVELRAIRKRLSMTPFLGNYSVVIIEEAHLLGEASASTLLKVLEEPNKKTLFVLLARNERLVLPTILSRCLHIRLGYVPDETIERALKTTSIANLRPYWCGRPALAHVLLEDVSTRERVSGYAADCGQFLHGTLYKRFAILEKYTKRERSELNEILQIWIEYVRTNVSGAPRVPLMRHLSSIYATIATTNASSVFLLNSFALNAPRVAVA
ncbi:MAG: AAA family ATPase [Candidatus Spechtbacterales bacterium]